MARPQKQTVDYFPHDAKASEGDTLTILQSQFGNDGYAFWFKLLEKISSSENHVIDCRNPRKWQLLLAKTSASEEKGSAIMNLLCELEAIDAQLWRESRIIWCQNLVDNIADAYKNRNRPVPERPIFTTDNSISSRKNPISSAGNPQTKLNETKLNKTIYIVLFNLWNEQGIITHKNLTSGMKQAIDSARKDYSQEEIEQAMRNYAVIAKGTEYYFDHKWTLAEFLSRGKGNNIERFLDLEVAKSNFKKEAGHGAHQRDTSKSGRFAGFKAIESGPDEPEDGDED